MSDTKPRRMIRESGRSEIAGGDMPVTGPVTGGPTTQPAPSTAPGTAPASLAAASPDTGPAALPAALPVALPAALIEPAAPATDEPWAAFAEMQTALARGLEEAAAEMTTLAWSGIAAASDAGIAMLGARTLAEAAEINAGLVRRRTDAMIEGSTRLSGIGVKAATEASRAILVPLGTLWSGAGLA